MVKRLSMSVYMTTGEHRLLTVCTSCARRRHLPLIRDYFIVGITKSVPRRMPVGQLVVIVFRRV